MSRYPVQVSSAAATDSDATLGYDRPLRTFFVIAFPDEETDDMALWLWTILEEYPSLESLVLAAREMGYEIGGLKHVDMLAMIKEAGTPMRPSIGEILGIVK